MDPLHMTPERTFQMLNHMSGWQTVCYCTDCVRVADERNRQAAKQPRHGGSPFRWGGMGSSTYRRY